MDYKIQATSSNVSQLNQPVILVVYVAHLRTLDLVRRIAWHIMILGPWSRVGAPGGRHG